ncbi:hypothetical protein ASG90_05945 [Nocardioides sp. Soil797]|nr:hypothetical protein ASG90_05945 [Nocardioides sp. Soil797]
MGVAAGRHVGKGARIRGDDLNPKCKDLEQRNTKIFFIGDQANREFLRSIIDEIGPDDVLIEDRGHRAPQQIATFEEFRPTISGDGPLARAKGLLNRG